MSASLDDLTTPLTLDEVRASIYAVLAATGVTTTTWKPGSVVRTIITAVALIAASVSRLQALIVRAGWVTLSSGPWLALCAYYERGVSKLLASFAVGIVTVNNTGGGVYGPLNPGDLIFASSVTGKTYTNTAIVNIAALQVGVQVAVQATEVGSASSANPGDVSVVVSNLAGLTCTNASAIIGTDDELDTNLQLRCDEKLGSLSPNGPPDAYSYVARSAGRDANGLPVLITPTTPGVAVGVNRVLPVRDGLGGLAVYIATPTGAVTGTAGDLSTDLGVVDDLLQRLATPLACTLTTHSATARLVAATYEIWLYTNAFTDSQIEQAIASALASFMSERPIGGDVVDGVGAVWASAVEAIIGSAQASPGIPLGIFRTDLATVDLVLATTEVPVLGTVTCTAIHRVKRAGT